LNKRNEQTKQTNQLNNSNRRSSYSFIGTIKIQTINLIVKADLCEKKIDQEGKTIMMSSPARVLEHRNASNHPQQQQLQKPSKAPRKNNYLNVGIQGRSDTSKLTLVLFTLSHRKTDGSRSFRKTGYVAKENLDVDADGLQNPEDYFNSDEEQDQQYQYEDDEMMMGDDEPQQQQQQYADGGDMYDDEYEQDYEDQLQYRRSSGKIANS
jgi:hypothetical protein